MNGGTVSMCVEKTTSGLRSSGIATTLNLSWATGILCALYPRRQSSSYSSAPTAPSLPEMDSMSISLRVSLIGSMSARHKDKPRLVIKRIVANGIKSFFLDGPAGRLESLLNEGQPDATHAALVCHPHPLFGGTMHNKVVYHAMKTLSGFGFPVLRFNFRGAGMSEGEHDKGHGEQEDVQT